MDIYDQLTKVKKLLKLTNEDFGTLIEKTGDTFRKSMNRKSLTDYEIEAIAKSLDKMKLSKDPKIRNEVDNLLNMITKKITKNKHLIVDKILSEGEESKLKELIIDDPAYKDMFNDPEAVYHKEKGTPYYDIDFTASFLEVENNQQSKPDSYVTHPFFKGCDFIVRASGQSMAKVIKHGDAIGLVKVDDWLGFLPMGEIYAIVTSNGFRMIKIISKGKDNDHFCLISKPTDNKKDEFPNQDIAKNKILSIFKVQASSHLF